MNLQEFEFQTKDATHEALDQLQAAMLLVEGLNHHLVDNDTLKGMLESQVVGVGSSVKNLVALIEGFVEEQGNAY